MTTISLLLPMRALVKRPTTSQATGTPTTTWTVFVDNLPCLFSRTEALEMYSDTKSGTARSSGTLFFDYDAGVRPGDSVTISGSTYIVLGDGGQVADWLGQPHHLEWAARQQS